MFKSELWSDFLRSESLHWVEDQAYWTGGGAKGYKDVSWNDYSNIDLIVAIRRDPSNKYNNKPASKLINAWLAGVPAILGAEVAYRELRKSRLDYMEAVTLEDVIGSIRMLKSNPEVYKSMVDNGKIRAQEFGAKKIEARWLCLLMDDLTKIYHSPFWLMMRHLPIGARKRFRKILATDGALI
ncbi:MAG: hypothetical protein B7Y41_04730 [Hydrogenophilales bacterium 28-61-23]|nr:MAG: hypothetical protein B7Y41_04730 [Hydrogenophilales bacterium 28-61-23]